MSRRNTRPGRWAWVLLVLLVAGSPGMATAIPLTITPDDDTLQWGQVVDVTIELSDVDVEHPGSSLRAFTLEFSYSPDIIVFEGATFGTALGGPGSSLTTATALGGIVTLTETSLLTNVPPQTGTFTLATMSFRAMPDPFDLAEFGSLDTSLSLVGDELVLSDNGAPQMLFLGDLDAPPDLELTVTPEPSTALLLGAGALALGLGRRARRRS